MSAIVLLSDLLVWMYFILLLGINKLGRDRICPSWSKSPFEQGLIVELLLLSINILSISVTR
jgi:hypothetical protein